VHLIIWRLWVRPGREAEFEQVYGPAGDWAQLFARGDGFIGTELLRDVAELNHYVTIDRWTSRAAFETFRERWADDYRELDKRCEALTLREEALGTFTEPGSDP
jgi:heme-degrading monooxygenase HmoA